MLSRLALPRRLRDDETGVTLVELLVAMAISTIVMGPVLASFIAVSRSATFAQDEIQAQNLGRVGLERVTRFVRQATYPEDKTPSNSTLFDRAEGNRIVYFADIDNDGEVERVRFELVGTIVRQTFMECQVGVNPCEYELLSASEGTPVIGRVHNDELDTGLCRDFSVNEPVFRYYERSSDGELTALPLPVPGGLFGRIAAVEVTFIVDVTEERAPECRRLQSLVHFRNWRG